MGYRDDSEYYKKHKISKSFAPTTHSMLMHENYLRLTPEAKVLYLYMTDYAKGETYFKFPKSIYNKIMCNETFKKKKSELIEYGFIEEVENGKFTRTENVYKFNGEWKSIKRPPKQKRQTKLNSKK